MHSNVTSKNVGPKWLHFSWATLYMDYGTALPIKPRGGSQIGQHAVSREGWTNVKNVAFKALLHVPDAYKYKYVQVFIVRRTSPLRTN